MNIPVISRIQKKTVLEDNNYVKTRGGYINYYNNHFLSFSEIRKAKTNELKSIIKFRRDKLAIKKSM